MVYLGKGEWTESNLKSQSDLNNVHMHHGMGGIYSLHKCSFSLYLACYTEFSIHVVRKSYSYTIMGYYYTIKQSCKICTKQLKFVKYLSLKLVRLLPTAS